MGSLGSLLSSASTFFGRSLFIAGLLPVVIIVLVNSILLHWIVPGSADFLGTYVAPSRLEEIRWQSVFVLFVLIIVSKIFLPVLLKVLEGGLIPGPLVELFRTLEINRRNRLFEQVTSLENDVLFFRQPFTSILKTHRETGLTGGVTQLNEEGLRTLESLELKCRRLTNEKVGVFWRSAETNEVRQLFKGVCQLLTEYSADDIRRVDQLQVACAEVLRVTAGRVELPYNSALQQIYLKFPDVDMVQPTYFGNLVQAHRQYGLERYGFDVDQYWLQILKFVQQDAQYRNILDDARSRFEFSITLLFGIGFSLIIWLPISALYLSLISIFFIAAVTPPVLAVLYFMVQQTYLDYMEAVRGGIDLYRFDLLKALHIKLPDSPRDEREKWEELAKLSSLQDEQIFDH